MAERYKIEWHYLDDDEIHTTYVECRHRTLIEAFNRFRRFYQRTHRHSPSLEYVVQSIHFVGSVIAKKWR